MQTITQFDNFNIFDVIEHKRNQTKKPFLGLVRVFENGILNTDESEDGWLTNMTIGRGREFAAQKLFDKVPSNTNLGDLTNYKIDSFGIGSGGSIIDQHGTIDLLGPKVCDLDLYTPIPINSECLTSGITPHIVKKIEIAGADKTDPDVIGAINLFPRDSSEYTDCNSPTTQLFTVVKSICIIDSQEPTYLTTGQSVKIDEAMLYATNPSNQVIPFAHICFAPKFIEKETVFAIEWYIIF